jgi:hypothetical protein
MSKHQGRSNRKSDRKALIARRCGMSVRDYDAILAEQDGACGCCKRTFKRVLDPDYDPITGLMTGLLCPRCIEVVDTVRHVQAHAEVIYPNLSRWKGEPYARALLECCGVDVSALARAQLN